MRKSRNDPALLCLDRDGTLIEECDYLADPARVKLLPRVVGGLKRLQKAGFALVVISNQSGVARGLLTRQQVRRVNQRFLALLRERGVRLQGLYWCHHGPNEGCLCRKPEMGLLKRAARRLGVSWRRAVSVGDRLSDVALGQRSGGVGILVLTGYGRAERRKQSLRRPDYVARDFAEAARWIMAHHGKD